MSDIQQARVELLSPEQIEERLRVRSVVYIPLGTLEFHGPHLPVGLDALTAHRVCLEAAGLGGGVVLPPVYQGIGGGHLEYRWTIMMSAGDGLRAHIETTLHRLQELGVVRAVLFSGHFAPEQVELIDLIERDWNTAAHRLSVIATAVDRCPDASLLPDHAGIFETTLLAGIAPDLVHLDRLPPIDTHPGSDPGGNPFGAHRHEPGHPLQGVFGPDPRKADLSAGPGLLREIGSWLAGRASE